MPLRSQHPLSDAVKIAGGFDRTAPGSVTDREPLGVNPVAPTHTPQAVNVLLPTSMLAAGVIHREM